MIELFDAYMCDLQYSEKEELYRVLYNSEYCADLFAYRPSGMSIEDFKSACDYALRRKYGRGIYLTEIEDYSNVIFEPYRIRIFDRSMNVLHDSTELFQRVEHAKFEADQRIAKLGKKAFLCIIRDVEQCGGSWEEYVFYAGEKYMFEGWYEVYYDSCAFVDGKYHSTADEPDCGDHIFGFSDFDRAINMYVASDPKSDFDLLSDYDKSITTCSVTFNLFDYNDQDDFETLMHKEYGHKDRANSDSTL